MQETKRSAEEANRIGKETQEQTKRVGQEFQDTAQSGFEAATRSFGEVNRGFQAIAAEMTDFSKRRFEDVFHSWEQLLRARSFGEVVDVQARYAQNAYDAYMSEMSKLGEIYLDTTRSASKPADRRLGGSLRAASRLHPLSASGSLTLAGIL
jgi:hypothetical protein